MCKNSSIEGLIGRLSHVDKNTDVMKSLHVNQLEMSK